MDEETRAIVPLQGEASAELAVRPPEQLAAEVAKVLDLIAARLQLETPHPLTASRVRGARTVPREFVLSMIAAAERRPDFLFLSKFDSAEARAVLELIDEYRLLSERTAMLLASLNYTIEARWARVVADALHCFSLASILAKDPRDAELAAEIENLRRHLGRKGARKKKGTKKADQSSPE